MAERALFIGFGTPVRGREQRAVGVFNAFVEMFGRMSADGRIERVEVTLIDPHGGDLGGFFLVHGTTRPSSPSCSRRAAPSRDAGAYAPSFPIAAP